MTREFTTEHRQKLSESHRGNPGYWKGKKLTANHKKKIGLTGSILRKGKKRKPFSSEHRKNIGKVSSGRKLSVETRQKLRLSMIRYVETVCKKVTPNLGKNEKRILDELERTINYQIVRQFRVLGYFLDGYVEELNLAIEVDEKPKTSQRDTQREENIRNALNCEFLRINDNLKNYK